MLVKELQGLGLKVDLRTNDKVIDAEQVLAENIKDEASHAPTISSQPANDMVVAATTTDITTDDLTDDFPGMTEEEGPPSDEAVELADDTISINEEEA